MINRPIGTAHKEHQRSSGIDPPGRPEEDSKEKSSNNENNEVIP